MDNKKSNGQNYSDDVAMVIRVKKDLYRGNTYYAAECCTPDGILWGRIVKLSATPLRNRPHMVFCSQGTS